MFTSSFSFRLLPPTCPAGPGLSEFLCVLFSGVPHPLWIYTLSAPLPQDALNPDLMETTYLGLSFPRSPIWPLCHAHLLQTGPSLLTAEQGADDENGRLPGVILSLQIFCLSLFLFLFLKLHLVLYPCSLGCLVSVSWLPKCWVWGSSLSWSRP